MEVRIESKSGLNRSQDRMEVEVRIESEVGIELKSGLNGG